MTRRKKIVPRETLVVGEDIVHRPAVSEDLPFIYATMIKSFFKKSYCPPLWNVYHDLIAVLMDNSKIMIVCLPDAPNVILGYILYSPNEKIVHYLFVKQAFRRKGIALGLLEHHTGRQGWRSSHRTKEGDCLCQVFHLPIEKDYLKRYLKQWQNGVAGHRKSA